MEWFIFGLIALLSLFISTGIIAAPFTIGCLLAMLVLFKKSHVLLLAFILGILTDILSFHIVGLTSLFFLGLLGAVFLYERKFEIRTFQFVIVFSFLASMLYSLIFSMPHVLLGSIVTAIWASGIFFVLAVLDTHLPQKKRI